MLTLETAIEKIKQLPQEQQEKVFRFIEFIDFKHQQESQTENNVSLSQTTENLEQENFFSLAGIWENRDINLEEIRQQAWREQS
ncbi:MAG: hypothetical protein AB4062_09450 [Crocosphaera sp.]